jgi:hypothetical protein
VKSRQPHQHAQTLTGSAIEGDNLVSDSTVEICIGTKPQTARLTGRALVFFQPKVFCPDRRSGSR